MATIKSLLLAAGFVALAISATACRTKSAQCSDVIETYNALGEEMRKGIGDGTDPAAIEKAADAIDDKAKAFLAVDISEAALKTARDGLADTVGKHTRLLREMAGAVRDSTDAKKSDAAMKTIDGARSQFDAIATAIGSHKQSIITVCNATPK
ncbi:MAG: hypothetical protein KIT31_25060 [Deltaproteobacteria bacterium]|nr:hypothetical protein [Deltaproteobacteria bacterium]